MRPALVPRNKLAGSFAEAVAGIPDGATIAFGGFAGPGTPFNLIRALLAASGDTVVVATVKTFQPWGDIRSYATRMFENGGRGIGQKGKDNGLLVLLAVDDRQVWVEVGYDLEGPVGRAEQSLTVRPLTRPGT